MHAEKYPDEGRSFAECIFGSLELVLSIEVISALLSVRGSPKAGSATSCAAKKITGFC